MENFNINDFLDEPEALIISAGGDWQYPRQLSITLEEGKLQSRVVSNYGDFESKGKGKFLKNFFENPEKIFNLPTEKLFDFWEKDESENC